jgi:hypothetical protein
MYDEDVDVLSAAAIPTVYEEMEDNHEEVEDNLMFSKAGGIAITAVLILAVVLYLHLRLRQEYSLYEKDKVCCVLVCCRCLYDGYTHDATMCIVVVVYVVDTHIMLLCA